MMVSEHPEYDNALSDPSKYRSAKDSALFLQFQLKESLDRFGVDVPSTHEGRYLGVVSTKASEGYHADDSRRSRGSESINALRNPFGAEGVDEEEQIEDDGMEVDLASWGLDSFLPKDKESRKSKGKGRANADAFPNPHPTSPMSENTFSGKYVYNHATDMDEIGPRSPSQYESKVRDYFHPYVNCIL